MLVSEGGLRWVREWNKSEGCLSKGEGDQLE